MACSLITFPRRWLKVETLHNYTYEVPCTDSTHLVWSKWTVVFCETVPLLRPLFVMAVLGQENYRGCLCLAQESCILSQLLLPGKVRNWVVTMVHSAVGNYLHCWILPISHTEHYYNIRNSSPSNTFFVGTSLDGTSKIALCPDPTHKGRGSGYTSPISWASGSAEAL